MKTRKIIALLLALVMIASLAAGAFAASGAGHFGASAANDGFVPGTNNDNDDYYDEDDYYPEKEEAQGAEETKEPESNSLTTNIPSRALKALAEKRERNSEDTTKVITSYGLARDKTIGLLERHKDAEKGQGNREKVERYERILKANPYDYLAAYRLAQANFAMGRNSQAMGWVDKCLEIFPDYRPARALRNRLEAKIR